MKKIFLKNRFIGIILSAVFVSACVSDQIEVSPPVHVPVSFSASGEVPLPEKWWLAFQDRHINTLINQALSDNLNLKSAWERLSQAEAIARKSGAGLVPTVELNGRASRIQTRMDGATRYSDNFYLDLSASYELDLWERIRAGRDAALLDMYASQEDVMTTAITLSAETASIWYQLVEQYGQRKLLREQINTNKKMLEVVTLRFRRGQAAAADVLQQRQLVESNRGEQAQVASHIKVLKNQLAVLLGTPPNRLRFPHQTELPDLPPLPQTGLPADLIKRRPDITGAYYALKTADRRVAEAVADRFPRISLAAQVSSSGTETRDLFNDWINTIAANLLGPVIDGGRRRAEVDRTRAVADEKLYLYGQTILGALKEVETALVQERRRHQYIQSLEKQLALSAQAMKSIRDRYTKGAEDYLRVLSALSTHQQLQRTRLSAGRERVQDRIDLCRALGGGWKMTRN